MLCYVMLCYVMLCYVMLCYVMLCYVMRIINNFNTTFPKDENMTSGNVSKRNLDTTKRFDNRVLNNHLYSL